VVASVSYTVLMPQTNRLHLPSATLKQQIDGRDIWNELRSEGEADFFTLGYTGRKIADIVTTLKRYKVRTLVDIRRNPVSMYRPELSKNNLARLLSSQGIIVPSGRVTSSLCQQRRNPRVLLNDATGARRIRIHFNI
jgi:hypothetical protein